ncbi:MAG TPA: WXG100 family type VII secretion target, partial [Herpetosiphonaceae bacterium]
MAAALVQAEYDELEALAQRFGVRAERIDALREQLQTAMAPLQQGGWIGEGSEAFFSEMGADLLPGAARLTEALGAAQAATLQCSAILRAAEEEAAALFRNWAIDDKVKAGGVGAGAPVGGGGSGGG